MIHNTSSPDDRSHFLNGALAGIPVGRLIEQQEAEGQRQVVRSDRLPVEIDSGTQEEFEQLGFTFGDIEPMDPLFRFATMPDGWKRQPSDHSMWSVINDHLDRPRVAIFYKAAFYDRRAFMRLEDVDSYLTRQYSKNAPVVLDDSWATEQAVTEAARARLLQTERYLTTDWGHGDPEMLAEQVWFTTLLETYGATR